MVAYNSYNVILVAPFTTRKHQHRLATYNSITEWLNNRGLDTGLKSLYNEASQNYKATIKDKRGVDLQLVPPGIHRRNEAERAIHTFKAHLLAMLSGVAPDFPQLLWDLLLVKTEMTLNFLRQSTFNRKISA